MQGREWLQTGLRNGPLLTLAVPLVPRSPWAASAAPAPIPAATTAHLRNTSNSKSRQTHQPAMHRPAGPALARGRCTPSLARRPRPRQHAATSLHHAQRRAPSPPSTALTAAAQRGTPTGPRSRSRLLRQRAGLAGPRQARRAVGAQHGPRTGRTTRETAAATATAATQAAWAAADRGGALRRGKEEGGRSGGAHALWAWGARAAVYEWACQSVCRVVSQFQPDAPVRAHGHDARAARPAPACGQGGAATRSASTAPATPHRIQVGRASHGLHAPQGWRGRHASPLASHHPSSTPAPPPTHSARPRQS